MLLGGMEPGGARKRRKWDVAAPQGVPASQPITNLQGFAAQGTAPTPAAQPTSTQPLTDDLKARAQQAAAAAVAKISQVWPLKLLSGDRASAAQSEKTGQWCRTW